MMCKPCFTFSLAAVLLSFASAIEGQSSAVPAAPPVVKAEAYGKLPLSFEANRGQTDPQVRFLSRGNGYSLFLTDSAAVLSLRKGDALRAKPDLKAGLMKPGPVASVPKTDLVRMELAGASRGLRVEGADKLPGTANYFMGNDPAKWRSAVPTYAKVRYAGVYPGVDLVYYGNQSQLEYDFVVAPHADPKPIRLHFAGASKLRLDPNGDLEVIARNGQIAFHKPVVYQEIAGKRQPVEGSFSLLARNVVSFTLGSYDREQAVVIDPTLAYSTYLGGAGLSAAKAITTDQVGNAYVTGFASQGFPTTPGAFQSKSNPVGAPNAFISKLNSTGTALVYSTYLGGSSNSGDAAYGIAVDSAGSAYVTGTANSVDFPVTSGAYQTSCGIKTIFVSKLNTSGTGLIYSTCIGQLIVGAFAPNSSSAIAVDGSGNAYVVGKAGGDYPTTSGSFQTTLPSIYYAAPFVTKVDAGGSHLVYSTFLGNGRSVSEGQTDYASGIAVDTSGNAYVTGITYGGVPTTSGAYQTSSFYGANYVTNFVTKINLSGSKLIYSTYLGGSTGTSSVYSIASSKIKIDSSGSAYMMSSTGATNYPTTSGAYLTTQYASGANGLSTVLSKLSPNGSNILASTYLSGTGGSSGTDLALDSTSNIYVTGIPGASFPLTSDAIQSVSGGSSFYVAKMSSDLTTLLYSTLLGGNFSTAVSAITVDIANRAYVTGYTYATTYPTTPGAFETTDPYVGDPVGFVSAIAFSGSQPSTTPPGFASMAYIPTGASTAGVSLQVVAADFDGDGYQDLATTNNVDASVSVLLGKGNGTFQSPVTYGTGNGPYGVVAGDFNGDGKPDLAVVNGLDNTVSILLNSAGSFPAKPSFTYSVGSQPYGVSMADFNHDGFLDLVVTNNASKTLSVLLGKGDGSFSAAVSYATGNYPFGTAVADFNNDGYPDLVVWNLNDNTVGVLLNSKTGTFLPQVTYATGADPFGVVTGDFNGDGYPDLAVANLGGNTVSVLLNNKAGGFLARVSYPAGTLPSSVLARDLNGDGVLDLATTNLGDGTVSVLLGKGDGTFLTQTVFAAGTQPYSLLAADFNGDGKPDLAVTSFFENTLGVLLQTSSGTSGRMKAAPPKTLKTVPAS